MRQNRLGYSRHLNGKGQDSLTGDSGAVFVGGSLSICRYGVILVAKHLRKRTAFVRLRRRFVEKYYGDQNA